MISISLLIGYPLQFEETAQAIGLLRGPKKITATLYELQQTPPVPEVEARTDSSAIRKSGRTKAHD
jgi:hypothetical protein